MKLSNKFYVITATIFIILVLIISFAPISEFAKGVLALPAAGSLFSALYQLFRDQFEHERRLELQRQQHFFNLGVTSHMANIVFDKYVEFCEGYLEEVDKTIGTLLRDGPTEKAGVHANDLARFRRKYYAWISNDINKLLEKFEIALIHLGMKSKTSLSEAEKKWDELLGVLISGEENKKDIAAENIRKKIRELLGTDQLTEIRKWIVSEAEKYIKQEV